MADNKPNLLIIPGDGIGPEVIRETSRVIEWFEANRKVTFDITHGQLGVAAYHNVGAMTPDDTLDKARKADAILFGAIGGDGYEDIPIEVRREDGLLALRKKLGLFANIRPAVAFDELLDASSLKPEVVRGVDLIIVRELSSGIYFGEPRGIEDLGNGVQRGFNTMQYTTPEIQRVARLSFELARGRRNQLCSIEKSNVLETSKLWRAEVRKLHQAEYSDVDFKELIVDADRRCGGDGTDPQPETVRCHRHRQHVRRYPFRRRRHADRIARDAAVRIVERGGRERPPQRLLRTGSRRRTGHCR
jgi:3-isopropylmalate dehydrogenase